MGVQIYTRYDRYVNVHFFGDPAAASGSIRHHTGSSSSSSEDSTDGTASWEVTEMSSETFPSCCRSRHFFCTSTNQSIRQEMGIFHGKPDVSRYVSRYVNNCQQDMSRWSVGVDSGLIFVLKNLQIARQKLCFGCWDKKGFNESPKSHTIHAMLGLLCALRYFSLFFHCLEKSLLSIFFSKKSFDM